MAGTSKNSFVLATAMMAAFFSASLGRSRAAEPYLVDVILPITGNASFVGVAHRSVLKLVEDVMNKKGGVNGRPFQMRIL